MAEQTTLESQTASPDASAPEQPAALSLPPDAPIGWRIRYRLLLSLGAHGVLFAISLLIAFALKYDFRLAAEIAPPKDGPASWFWHEFLPYLPLTLAIKLAVFARLGLYRDSWKYVGLRDLFAIIKAAHWSIILCVVIYCLYVWTTEWLGGRYVSVPNGVFLLDWVFTIAAVATARVGYRFYCEELRPLPQVAQTRIVIVGASDGGDSILREIIRTSEDRYLVVGFLDDDHAKQSARIRGIEVLGRTRDIRTICEQRNVDEVIIAPPYATQRQIRSLVEHCQGMNLLFRTVPAVSDLIEGKVQVSQIRPVEIADLLGRDPVTLDTGAIGRYIHGKVVMVTGAGGSIGAEMCRQICRFRPNRLLLVERMENALFEIDRDLAAQFPEIDRVPYVADIADGPRLRKILITERPTAIFHAAAHKHVPMMEWNPGEAIKNNVIGTRTLADAACEAGVARFVMISTDKAVNPTSIMGCSKRVAEMYVQQLSAHLGSRTEFITVRFGNVLGSSGSVVPIFKDQIARGGPITVTHPEMTRYFMTIPEASQLVLQAGAMGVGGEIFLLDMGEPVKIVDLAIDLITLSGLRPHEDVEIKFTGIRPGEKLFEELSIDGEDVSRTEHPKIGIIRKRPEDFDRVSAGIGRLLERVDGATPAEIRAELRSIVPEYVPSTAGAAFPAPRPSPPRGLDAATEQPARDAVLPATTIRPA